jgi:hypothetical protein
MREYTISLSCAVRKVGIATIGLERVEASSQVGARVYNPPSIATAGKVRSNRPERDTAAPVHFEQRPAASHSCLPAFGQWIEIRRAYLFANWRATLLKPTAITRIAPWKMYW